MMMRLALLNFLRCVIDNRVEYCVEGFRRGLRSCIFFEIGVGVVFLDLIGVRGGIQKVFTNIFIDNKIC